MKHYVQLTHEQRYQIDVYRKARMDQIETAEQLEVDRSTISREIRRNQGWRGDRASRRKSAVWPAGPRLYLSSCANSFLV